MKSKENKDEKIPEGIIKIYWNGRPKYLRVNTKKKPLPK